MAISDYILCCKCDVKLIYDGGKDNNRQWWIERWGKEPEIMCPDCEKKLETVSAKHMLKWVDRLKRLSDNGQHMSIPGLRSGDCWELAIELEQFIRTIAPPQRKPLPPQSPCEMTQAESKMFKLGWLECEAAHGIKGEA